MKRCYEEAETAFVLNQPAISQLFLTHALIFRARMEELNWFASALIYQGTFTPNYTELRIHVF